MVHSTNTAAHHDDRLRGGAHLRAGEAEGSIMKKWLFYASAPVWLPGFIAWRAVKDLVLDAPHLSSRQSQIDYWRATGRQSRETQQKGETK